MPDVPPPAGPEAATPTPAPAPAPVNPELQVRLSNENANLRVKNNELAARVKAIEELGSLDDIKAALDIAKANSPSATGDKKSPEVVKLQREYDALKAETTTIQKTIADRDSRARAKILTAELTKIAAEGGLNAPASAVKILGAAAKVADDDEVVFVIPDGSGGTREVPATYATLKEHAKHLLGDAAEVFLPAEGVAGTGSRGPVKQAGGLDIDAILKDPLLYEKHREAIFQARFNRPAPK